MSQMTVCKVVELNQVWMAKDEAQIFFGYRMHKPLFQKLLKEFKDHPDFADGYRLPTHNMPIIEAELFDRFLKWREKNKFKRNKSEVDK